MINGKSSGYTIIEILVALSIVGLIFSAGFINFRDFSRRQLLAGTLRSLKGDLRLAQEYALIGKKPDGANCGGANILDSYGFFVADSTRYLVQAYCTGGPVEVKNVTLPVDIEISSTTSPINFKILGEGTNLSTDATISLTQVSTGKSSVVTVSKGGEIK